jgi:hypothetical protein
MKYQKMIKHEQQVKYKPGVCTPPMNLCTEKNMASLYTALSSTPGRNGFISNLTHGAETTQTNKI